MCSPITVIKSLIEAGALVSGKAGQCQNISLKTKQQLLQEGFTAYQISGGNHRFVLVEGKGGEKIAIDGAPIDTTIVQGEIIQGIHIEDITGNYDDSKSPTMPLIKGQPFFKL